MPNHAERPPIDTFWVVPHTLLAGEYPGHIDEEKAQEKINWLIEQGVTAFVDLTEDGELRPYMHLSPDQVASGQQIAYVRTPIRDVSIPTVPEMIAILNHIDAKIEERHIVYVHCWGGIGRTGTVIGCYLVRHGMKGDEALEAIAQLRKQSKKAWRVSPETNAQRAMVRAWVADQ